MIIKMSRVTLFLLIITLLLKTIKSEDLENNGKNTVNEFGEESTVLSRRKRFLTFPEGSSFQLVFCVQTSALITIGDIFLYSNTAALAWTLPTDPMFFDMLKGKDKAIRRGDSATMYIVDTSGKVIGKTPYKKPIINPAFAKRSVDDKMSFKEKLKIKLDKMKMHQKQSHRDYLKSENLDEYSIEFHRNSRLDLYKKVEILLNSLGKEGRQFVLYKLCESAQWNEQGTFLQEFLRAVFTLPKGKEFTEDHHREYDHAHNPSHDCRSKYPNTDFWL